MIIHSKLCPENMLKLHEQLEEQFKKMKGDTVNLGTKTDRTLTQSLSFFAQQNLIQDLQLDTNVSM